MGGAAGENEDGGIEEGVWDCGASEEGNGDEDLWWGRLLELLPPGFVCEMVAGSGGWAI